MSNHTPDPRLGSTPANFRLLVALAVIAPMWGSTAGCHAADTRHASPRSVEVAVAHAEAWRADDDYAKLDFPFVGGPAGQRLNPIIQRWIGARCPGLPGSAAPPADAAACVAAFSSACAALKHDYGADTGTFGCTLDATTEIRLDAAGLLGAIYTTYSYTGGAHGSTVVSYLNLDLASGRVFTLEDLLDTRDTARLSGAIERAIRAERHIPAGRSLEQAGFFTNTLPLPGEVLALPQGLLFTYQSYDVAPYSEGQPHGLVAYTELDGMIRATRLLAGLRALGAEPAPAP